MIWQRLRHFSKEGPDHWGDPGRMDPMFLLLLDQLRDTYGSPFVVFEGYAIKGHIKGSRHYLGCAADFYIKDEERDFFSQVCRLCACLAETRAVMLGWQSSVCSSVTGNEITGLGIYPENNIPSFHLDIRPEAARWGRISGKYVSFKEAIKVAKNGAHG